MQRIEWVHKRIEAWALWIYAGSGGGSGGAMFDPNRVDQTGDVRAGMRNTDPAFNAAALEMDQAIARLPGDLKRAVIAAYTWEGGMQEIAATLGCTRMTLHRRLCNADRRIAEWIEARRMRGEQLRSAGEFLQLIHHGP